MECDEAEEIKKQGNAAFAAGDFEIASQRYSASIELLPENALFYSNRAAAYLKLGHLNEALQDAESAIEFSGGTRYFIP